VSGVQFGRHLKLFFDSRESDSLLHGHLNSIAEPIQGPPHNVNRLQACSEVKYNSQWQHFVSGVQFGRHLKLFFDSRESDSLLHGHLNSIAEPIQGPPHNVNRLQACSEVKYNSQWQHFG
jgi:hypothetical protein